ncbi:MAG: DUF3006 domain-containing protein [Ruminococcus sp.]|jgi:hypothetical protein|nr:DUF3006 domain-containing protein [Ruminococcus sp.]
MLIIDRIESSFAVVETEKGHINVPLKEILGTPAAGDIIEKADGGYRIKKWATERRREEINKKLSGLWD